MAGCHWASENMTGAVSLVGRLRSLRWWMAVSQGSEPGDEGLEHPPPQESANIWRGTGRRAGAGVGGAETFGC